MAELIARTRAGISAVVPTNPSPYRGQMAKRRYHQERPWETIAKQMANDGFGREDIAAELRKRGIRGWDMRTIRRIVLDPNYARLRRPSPGKWSW